MIPPDHADDAERLDVLALDDLAAREPGQEAPRWPHQPEPLELEFDIDEFEEWDGALPDDAEAAE